MPNRDRVEIGRVRVICSLSACPFREADCAAQPPPPELPRRQMEVLRLLVQDLNHKTIARLLGVTEKQVQNQRSKIFRALRIHGLCELTQLALQWGWLEPICAADHLPARRAPVRETNVQPRQIPITAPVRPAVD
jgi:DNA-binding CsgD family transcriptional regulator